MLLILYLVSSEHQAHLASNVPTSDGDREGVEGEGGGGDLGVNRPPYYAEHEPVRRVGSTEYCKLA